MLFGATLKGSLFKKKKKTRFFKLSLVFMLTSLGDANIQVVLGCLRKVGNVFSVKKVWGMELHFVKGKESKPDLQVAF